jgi:hypothetical protein
MLLPTGGGMVDKHKHCITNPAFPPGAQHPDHGITELQQPTDGGMVDKHSAE